MNRNLLIKTITFCVLFIFSNQQTKGQCNYLPSTTTTFDTVSYNFSGGAFASFGCAPIDPTYWLAGTGSSVTVNFVTPQSYPTFRVWGMNTDDSASVTVNGLNYPLNQSSASYDTKVVCGLSPGPDGVVFSNGNLVGANSPVLGNFSYQNVQLIATNVSTFTVTSVSGAGWGFAGASVNCPLQTSVASNINDDFLMTIYPIPSTGDINITSSNTIDELKLSDFSGRIIYTQKANEKQIKLQLVDCGMYFLTIRSAEQTITTKLVISK